MKVVFTLLVAVFFSLTAGAVTTQAWQTTVADQPELAGLLQASDNFDASAFLDLTPKKFREITGERLGVKGTLALKAAQKSYKKQLKSGNRAEDIPKGLYIVAVLFGWGFLVMGLMDDWEGNNWWVNLILSLLCWLPGVIHGLVKMKDYY